MTFMKTNNCSHYWKSWNLSFFYKVMHVLTDHPIRYGDQQQRCDDKNGNLQHQNTAGIRKVHYMYSRCSDWSIVGTTQSEIPLSCHSITCVKAHLIERKKLSERPSLWCFSWTSASCNTGYLPIRLIFWKITRALYTVYNRNTETNLRKARVFVVVWRCKCLFFFLGLV